MTSLSKKTIASPDDGRWTVDDNYNRPSSIVHRLSSTADTLYIPLALFFGLFLLYALTATSAHTFDGIAYIRDMSKPLAAMVLPHHLIYEPAILGFSNLWNVFGWSGHADIPAQILSSLAGAGGVAVFYKLAWEISRSRAVALIATLALALTYGYWFYSVEVRFTCHPCSSCW